MGIKDSLIRLGEADSARWQLTLTEGSTFYLNNCRCIKNCDENYVILEVADGSLRVTGTDLILEGYGGRGVVITGKIHAVTLEE